MPSHNRDSDELGEYVPTPPAGMAPITMTTIYDTGPDADALRAAMKVFDKHLKLMAPHFGIVAEALAAAAAVYDEHNNRLDDERVAAMMGESDFRGLEVGQDGDVRMNVRWAPGYFASLVEGFDTLLRDAPNYVEWGFTVTAPYDADSADDQRPYPRKYEVILVRPGGSTPHALRKAAEDKLAAVIALADSGRPLLDPRAVAAAAGQPRPCCCDGEDPVNGFDWDCQRHSTAEITEPEILDLLPVARDATRDAVGAFVNLYHDDPDKTSQDGLLVNILNRLFAHLRSVPREEQ